VRTDFGEAPAAEQAENYDGTLSFAHRGKTRVEDASNLFAIIVVPRLCIAYKLQRNGLDSPPAGVVD
jgi:hypothetical protein